MPCRRYAAYNYPEHFYFPLSLSVFTTANIAAGINPIIIVLTSPPKIPLPIITDSPNIPTASAIVSAVFIILLVIL